MRHVIDQYCSPNSSHPPIRTAIAILLLLFHFVMAGTPTEALKAFQQAAKAQKLEDAWKHTAQFEGASEEARKVVR
jgi:hypothetical protein